MIIQFKKRMAHTMTIKDTTKTKSDDALESELIEIMLELSTRPSARRMLLVLLGEQIRELKMEELARNMKRDPVQRDMFDTLMREQLGSVV